MSNDVSHSMNDPPPPSDAYRSTGFHSSNNFQPAMSNDIYYFTRSDNSNVVQSSSDPIPEVTKKLTQGTRPTSRKTKRDSTRTKFLGSKYVAQELPRSIQQASSSLLLVLTPMFIRDFKEDARISMIKALFQENLFLSPSELSTIAQKTLDTMVTRCANQNPAHWPELILWKSGSDGKSCLTRLKGVLKEIHGDFQEVAVISWILAYGLSLDITNTRYEMQATRVADLTLLLSNYLFADKIVEVTMNDGRIILCRTPFGHAAILDMLEHIISCKQYSCYICLNVESWKPRLTNAIFLAVTTCAWSLENALSGPWSAATKDFQTNANRTRYTKLKSRLDPGMLSDDERLRLDELLDDMCDALKHIIDTSRTTSRSTAISSDFARKTNLGYTGILYKVIFRLQDYI
ncbi:hypothetical protein F4604DRAFT_1684512 [Suillus subluteus]|nr:hypothetical protein F4604DRAFT_1684512 [Suillus subluteus]